MKTLISLYSIGLFFLVIFFFSSCEKKNNENGTGTAEFSISSLEETDDAKSVLSGDSSQVSYQIMFSVEDTEGNPVFTDKLIPLYTFGTGFVSENVEIEAGDYNLTKFMIINPEGSVIFAAPLEPGDFGRCDFSGHNSNLASSRSRRHRHYHFYSRRNLDTYRRFRCFGDYQSFGCPAFNVRILKYDETAIRPWRRFYLSL